MSEKTPLVLLPAFMATRALWQPQIDGLADIADIQVIELVEFDTVNAMADAVLAAAPDRFALAGLSLGGFTAFEILRRAPERVTKLALVSTTAAVDTTERTKARLAQIDAVRSGRFEEVVAGFLKVLQSPTRPWSPELQETVREMVLGAGPDCFFRQQNAMRTRVDSTGDLAAITCPTLIVHGRQDHSWPFENGEALAAGIPDAQFEAIDKAGHFPTLDHPEEVTAAMRAWLTA